MVLNYGFAKNWEAVGEFRVESSPEFEITDPGLFLKGVLKEGVLQEKEGVSFERRQHPGPAAEHLSTSRRHLAPDVDQRLSRRAAPDWQFTIGLTFGFSLPRLSRQ